MRYFILIALISILLNSVIAHDDLATCEKPDSFRFGYSDMPNYAMMISPQGDQLAIADDAGIHTYRTDNLRKITTFNEGNFGGLAISWSSDNHYLASYVPITGVEVWQSDNTLQPLITIPDPIPQQDVHTLKWSHDDTKLVLAGEAPTQIWDVDNDKLIFEMPYFARDPFTDRKSMTHSLATWSPDDRYLIVTQYENSEQVDVWDTTNWQLSQVLQSGMDFVTSLDWSSQNQIVLAGSGLRNATDVEIWNGDTFELEMLVPGVIAPFDVAWSPSGHLLAIGYPSEKDEELHIFEIASQSFIARFVTDHSSVRDIGWSSDDFVFARTHDGKVYKWNLIDNCLAGIITYEEPY